MIFEDLPQRIRDRFIAHGVDGMFDCTDGDLLPDGSFGTVWMGYDDESLYLLYGRETTAYRGLRRIPVLSFEETGFDLIPRSELGKCEVERRFTTARAVAKTDSDEPKEILSFTMGKADRTAKFLRELNRANGEKQEEEPQQHRGPGKERKKQSARSTFFRLFGLFKEFLPGMLLYFAVLLLSTGFSLISPYLGTKILYDNVLVPGDPWYGKVGAFILMLLCVRLIHLGITMAQKRLLSADVAPRLIYALKTKVFAAMQRLSVGFYADRQTGELMNRIYDDTSNVYGFFADVVPFFCVNCALIVGILIIMFRLNTLLTLTVIVLLPLIAVVYYAVSGLTRKMHHRNWVLRSAMVTQVSNTVTGQRIVKAFDRETEETDRFAVYSGRFRDWNLRLSNLQDTLFPLMHILTLTANALVLGGGGVLILNSENGFSLGMLMTFVSYLNMLYGPMESVSWISVSLTRCLDAAERIFEVVDAEPDVKESEDPVPMPEIKGEIELKNVTFEYEPGRPILKEFSLKAEAGKTLGVVGKTGAGKSTLANLIARLYDPTEGTVTLDGVDLRRIAMKDLRNAVGIVSQEVYLFHGTIADNIRYGKPDATPDEIIAAAKAAAAHEFILRLPDAYNTRIGSGEADLSGGERQRIAIARAILQNPKILILDEATASMDTVTERKIRDALTALQQGRTTISIAHRLSTLRDADKLAVLKDGTLAEYGTHEELLRKQGIYHELYRIQAEALRTIAIAE